MSGFEAQCDCELDSPGVMSEHPVAFRLVCWTDWALYLKKRIETHYRPRIAELEAENEALRKITDRPPHPLDPFLRAERAEAELAAEHTRWMHNYSICNQKRHDAEAALAEWERMLRLAAWDKYRRKSHQDQWLADLRARASEPSA
jgi:hypothetical protein